VSPRLTAAVVIATAAVLAGCGASGTTTPRPAPAATPPCAWTTATANPGQVVTVTATGPGCADRTVVDRLTADTGRPWTTTALIPGALGALLAQLTRGRTTIRVWFTGPATGRAARLAGQTANALQAGGWTPQEPGQ
jgi:hypothetical protein